MKITTWNVNSLRVRLEHVLDWLKANPVDALGLQELKMQTADFPHEAFAELGYHAAVNGQKTYNGVALLAKAPPQDVVLDLPGFDDPQKRVVTGTVGGVRIVNAYVVNGQSVGSEKYDYKLRWLAALAGHVRDELARHERLVVIGDFNIAPTPEDTHDPDQWEGKILCSEAERAAFGALLDLGLTDCFTRFPVPEQRFTWWDYRQAAFRRNLGLRIDHVLASTPLAGTCAALDIDLAPRRLERPSDHAPVTATFGPA